MAAVCDQVLAASYAPGTYPMGLVRAPRVRCSPELTRGAHGGCDVAGTVQRTPSFDDIFVAIPNAGGGAWSECGAAHGQAGGFNQGAQVAWSPSGGDLPAGVNGIQRLCAARSCYGRERPA
jgi:hypothetical protein